MKKEKYIDKEHLKYLKERAEDLKDFYPEFENDKKEALFELFKKVEKTPGSFLLHPKFIWQGSRDPAHASFVLSFGTGTTLKKEIKFRLPESEKLETVWLTWKPDRKKISLKNQIRNGKLKLEIKKPTMKFGVGTKEELLIKVNFENNLTFRFKNRKFEEKLLHKKLNEIYQDLTLTLHIPIKDTLTKNVKNSLSNFDIRDINVDLSPYIGGVIYATITSNKLNSERPLGFIVFSNLWLNNLIRVKKHWVNEEGRVKELTLESILTLIFPFSSFELFFLQKTTFEKEKPYIFVNNVNRLIVKLNK